MTITMADAPSPLRSRGRPRSRPRLRPLCAALTLAALAGLSTAPASQAAWTFTPRLDASETYSDNVALQADSLAQSQWVSMLMPGFTLADHGPRLQFDASYGKRFYNYSKGSTDGISNGDQQLSATAKARLIGELLFIDANASIARQTVSAFGPDTSGQFGNGVANTNSSEVKSYHVSPYLQQHFGSTADLTLRIAHDSVQADNILLGNTATNTVAIDVQSGAAFHVLGWGLDLSRMVQNNNLAQTTSSESANGTLRYLYSQQLTFSLGAGYDKFDYQTLGGVTQGKSWSTGLTWTPSTRSSVQASIGKRYFGDNYLLAVNHRSRLSVWRLNYTDAVTTSQQQFVLPASISTATLLDGLFAGQISDPAARAQAVQAYILSTGLPPSLANNINYFSNSYFLQKQLQASAAFNPGPRTTLIVTLANMQRTGLSTVQTASDLLGPNASALNDNLRQRSATAVLNWRWSARTAVNVAADYSTTRSEQLGNNGNNKALRLALNHRLAQRLTANLELRRVQGALGGGSHYTENAITATLSKQF